MILTYVRPNTQYTFNNATLMDINEVKYFKMEGLIIRMVVLSLVL